MKVGGVLYKIIKHRNEPSEIKQVTVTKIGNKYMYYDGSESKVDKNTLRHTNPVYSQLSYQLYKSEQEILDRWELEKLNQKFSRFFNYSTDLSLQQLMKTIHQELILLRIGSLSGEQSKVVSEIL